NNDGNNDKLAANECNGSPKKKVFLSFGIDQILSKEYKERNSIGLYTTESGYTTGSLIRSSLDHQNLARSTMERLITENNQDTINEECIEVNPLQPDYRNSLSKEVEYVTKKTEYPEHNEIEQLARNMNLSVHNIKVWFQNRRSRRKKAVEKQINNHKISYNVKSNKESEIVAVELSDALGCSVCYEKVKTISNKSDARFALLQNCHHLFCLNCIRRWKSARYTGPCF
ncbi:hypothetical protein GJ496_005424, partial [Pomphorhynchus laevis]